MEDNFPDLVLLAGGKSTRMGLPKGLVPVGGKPWLVCQINALAKNGIQRVVLVLGEDARRYQQEFPWVKGAEQNWVAKMGLNISAVINPTPHYGPFSSLLCAWNFLKKETPSRIFLLPIDVPCPAEKVFQQLCETGLTKKVCVPIYKKKGGHPVLLTSHFLDELLQIPLDSPEARLDYQIHKIKGDQVKHVPVNDPKVCLNLNTWEEMCEMLAPHHGIVDSWG